MGNAPRLETSERELVVTMAWMGFFLLVAASTAIVMVPGVLCLWLLGVRDYRALLWSPAVGIGLLGLLTVVASPLGGWSWVYPAALTVILTLGLVWQKAASPSRVPFSSTQGQNHVQSRWVIVAALAGVVVFGVAYLPFFISYVSDPALPQTLNLADAGFHLTGAKLVADTGDVNPLTALAGVKTPVAGTATYYPTLWHALVALLVPITSVGGATNAVIVTVGIVFWPLSLSALALAVAPRIATAAFWAPMMAVTSMLFPGSILFRWSMDPFGLSVVLIPAALAVAVCWQRRPSGQGIAVFVLIMVGALMAQPSTALLLLVIPLVVVFSALAWSGLDALREGRWGSGLIRWGGLAALLVAGAVGLKVLVRLPFVIALGNFQRAQLGYRGSLVELMRGGPTYPETATSYLPFAIIFVVGGLWALWLLRSQPGWVFAGTAFAFLLIYMASSGPDNVLRLLTGPWYKDYTRLAVPVIAVASASAGAALATGLESLLKLGRPRGQIVAGALAGLSIAFLVLSPLLGWGGPLASIKESIRRGYDLGLDDETVLNEDAVALLQGIGSELPAGSYILGSPSSGAPFAVAVSDQYGFTRWVKDPTITFLAKNIDQIGVDPQVCEAVEQAEVSAVLVTDTVGSEQELEANQGLYNLDPSSGFELVAQRGELALYRITACE